MLADSIEIPHTPGAAADKNSGKRQSEFLDAAWGRCEALLPAVQAAWSRSTGQRHGARPLRPESLAPVYRKCLRNAMRLLSVESLMPPPLAAAARRVLPNSSPDVPATALWGPVMSWCLILILADAVDGDHLEQTALDLFDRLRLREPLAHAFNALGIEGEAGWKAAARLKILLLIQSGATLDKTPPAAIQTKAAEALASEAASVAPSLASPPPPESQSAPPTPPSVIPPPLWHDPDVRWLTGFNEAEGHAYVVRERYEELLWWLSLPEILKLANVTVPTRSAATTISKKIAEALTAVEKAGYRVDALMGKERKEPETASPRPVTDEAAAMTATSIGSKPGENMPVPAPEDLEPEEPVKAKPVGPANPEGPPEDY